MFFSGQSGKYLQFGASGELTAAGDSDTPQVFYLEVRDPIHMCIKNEAGRYVNGGKNGAISLGSADAESATKWEY